MLAPGASNWSGAAAFGSRWADVYPGALTVADYRHGLYMLAGAPTTFAASHTVSTDAGTYFDSDGLLKTAAEDAPRFDWRPDQMIPLGLAIDPGLAQQFTGTDDFGDVTEVDLTVAAAAITGVDGTTDDVFVLNEGSEITNTPFEARFNSTPDTLAMDDPIMFSGFFKPAGRNAMGLRCQIPGDAVNRLDMAVHLGTGVVLDYDKLGEGATEDGGAEFLAGRVGTRLLANGWVFVWVITTILPTTGGNQNARMQFHSAEVDGDINGLTTIDGDAFYMSKPSIMATSLKRNFIANAGGTSQARAADDITLDVADGTYDIRVVSVLESGLSGYTESSAEFDGEAVSGGFDVAPADGSTHVARVEVYPDGTF